MHSSYVHLDLEDCQRLHRPCDKTITTDRCLSFLMRKAVRLVQQGELLDGRRPSDRLSRVRTSGSTIMTTANGHGLHETPRTTWVQCYAERRQRGLTWRFAPASLLASLGAGA